MFVFLCWVHRKLAAAAGSKSQVCVVCRVLAKNHITIVYEDSAHIQVSAPSFPPPTFSVLSLRSEEAND